MSDHDPRNPLPAANLEQAVQLGAQMLAAKQDPAVVLSALGWTCLEAIRPDIQPDVQRAAAALARNQPAVVLRAFILTVEPKLRGTMTPQAGPMTASDIMGGGAAAAPTGPAVVPQAAPAPAPIPPGPRNLSPRAGGVAPHGAPDPATFGEQKF